LLIKSVNKQFPQTSGNSMAFTFNKELHFFWREAYYNIQFHIELNIDFFHNNKHLTHEVCKNDVTHCAKFKTTKTIKKKIKKILLLLSYIYIFFKLVL